MALQFHVTGLGGALCTVSMAPEASVPELKATIQETTGIASLSQRLLHDYRELRSDLSCFMAGETILLTLIVRTPEQTRWLQEVATSRSVSFWLQHAPQAAREDREVVLAAVARDGRSLRFASRELQADREVVLAAIAQSSDSFAFASSALRADRRVVLTAIAKCGMALQHAAAELRADREIALKAVTSIGFALEHVSPELQVDREVVLTAVTENGFALLLLCPELKADREIVLAAVASDTRALGLAAPEIQEELRGHGGVKYSRTAVQAAAVEEG